MLRSALVCFALMQACSGVHADPINGEACPEFAASKARYQEKTKYLQSEIEAFQTMRPEELQREMGRLCAALNGIVLIVDFAHNQLSACRDRGITGLDQAVASFADQLVTAKAYVGKAGCR